MNKLIYWREGRIYQIAFLKKAMYPAIPGLCKSVFFLVLDTWLFLELEQRGPARSVKCGWSNKHLELHRVGVL